MRGLVAHISHGRAARELEREESRVKKEERGGGASSGRRGIARECPRAPTMSVECIYS